MPKLSLAMIVKNEEARLGHCLDSVRNLVDEMVVVDTGSADGTRDLAVSAGARVHEFPWSDDFAAARNESLRHCTGDWVLVLDADEAIDALDHPILRRAMGEQGPQACRLILRNYYSGGGTTVQGEATQVNDTPYTEGAAFSHYADGRAVRLCRRLPDLAFRGRIHELLEPYFQERGLEVGNLEAVVHHYGKADPGRERDKQQHYLELACREAREDPDNLQLQFNVLQQAMVLESWELVLASARTYLSRARNGIHPLVLLGLASALQAKGQHEEALEALQHLLAEQPAHAQALVCRARSQVALGRVEEGRQSLLRSIEMQPGFIVPYVNLAELASQQGAYPTAREHLLRGLAASPRDPQLLHALVQLGVCHGDLDQAVQDALMAIQRCPAGGGGVWHRLVAYTLLQKGARAASLEMLELGLAAFPDQEDLLRLRTLVSSSSI